MYYREFVEIRQLLRPANYLVKTEHSWLRPGQLRFQVTK